MGAAVFYLESHKASRDQRADNGAGQHNRRSAPHRVAHSQPFEATGDHSQIPCFLGKLHRDCGRDALELFHLQYEAWRCSASLMVDLMTVAAVVSESIYQQTSQLLHRSVSLVASENLQQDHGQCSGTRRRTREEHHPENFGEARQ